MTFSEIVELMKRGMEKVSFSDRLKFDCGRDGMIMLTPEGVLTNDEDADCTIRISTENLSKLLSGKLNPMTGLALGKLKVSGNPAIAMKLGKLLG